MTRNEDLLNELAWACGGDSEAGAPDMMSGSWSKVLRYGVSDQKDIIIM